LVKNSQSGQTSKLCSKIEIFVKKSKFWSKIDSFFFKISKLRNILHSVATWKMSNVANSENNYNNNNKTDNNDRSVKSCSDKSFLWKLETSKKSFPGGRTESLWGLGEIQKNFWKILNRKILIFYKISIRTLSFPKIPIMSYNPNFPQKMV